MKNLITPRILDDKPLSKSEHAQFQFEAYSNTLARIILSKNNETPLVIGVYGDWGSGKTSLMQIVKAKVEESQNARQDKQLPSFMRKEDFNAFRPCGTVWFDAWKYSREEELWVSLIAKIGREIIKHSGLVGGLEEKLLHFKQKYNWTEAAVSAVTQLITGGRVSVDLKKSRFAENMAFYDEFQDFFDKIIADWTKREEGGALVVFIDDIDRCLPSKTVQVLEAIKLFMDRPGCIFVIGAEPKVVATAIKAHYEAHDIQGISGEEYLDKIVQVRFELPPPRQDDVTNYVKRLSGVEPFTRSYLELIVSGIRTNPRRIKMFVNYLELQWSLLVNMDLGELTNKQSLAEWLVLNEACPAFREEVQNVKEEVHITHLIMEMKELAHLPATQRKKRIESNEELGKFVDSETVIKVLKQGNFSFSKGEIEVYIHLSPAPSLKSQRKELVMTVAQVLDGLTEQEKRVLQLRFGLKGRHPRTLEEVGEHFHLSEERIFQIESKALRKLRHPQHSRRLRDYVGDPPPETHDGELELLHKIFGWR